MVSHSRSWVRRNPLLAGAIVIAVIGLIVLSLGSKVVQPSPVSIAGISSMEEGTYVSFLGVVRSLSPRDSGYSVSVCDSGSDGDCVSVLMSRSILPPTLIPGDYIAVRGSVKMYLGHMFIVPSQSADITIVNMPFQ